MSKAFRFALAVVLLTIIGSAAFISYKVFFANPTRTVPLLKGSSVIEAVQTLERMGIKTRIEEEDSSLPRGTVIGQWPETGVKLRVDRPAILKVSRGSEKIALPDLRGLTQEQAVRRLQEGGFIVGEIQKINNEKTAGTVIAQNPAAPVSIPQGREVGLLVSLGPTVASGQVIIPDLLERQEILAIQLARESSLRPSVEYVYTQASPVGMVIGMTPTAGSRVTRGSAVTLRVATLNQRYAPREAETPSTKRSAGGARVAVVTPATEPERRETPNNGSPANTPAQPSAETRNNNVSSRLKSATVRYQAPPVNNQTVVIEMVDSRGDHTLLNRRVRASESIRLNFQYSDSAVVTIYLGGNFVWQERYR